MLLSQIPSNLKECRDHRDRRDRLMRAYPEGIFIIPSSPRALRNPDVYYPFRQNSHLYYLSGFEEPGSCLVLVPTQSKPGGYQTLLFVMPKDPEKEMWEGHRYGVEGAVQVFGADEAYPINELSQKLPLLFQNCRQVFYRVGLDLELDRQVLGSLETYRQKQGRSGAGLLGLEDPLGPIGEMRLFKSPDEVALLRKACKISAQAHRIAMKEVRPGMNESEVEALVDYVFRREGCQRVGYGSIVAGGKNATCLHYTANNNTLQEGELLLIDAGGEYQYYTADITRTFPIGRSFSRAQTQVYDGVLQSQMEAIAMVKPGVRLPEIHKRVCEVMADGLLRLGLLKGKLEEILSSGALRKFYPHNTSHWLGMDVHDVGLYLKNGEPRELEPGMVLTIEPGFYVQPGNADVNPEYRNIGIRIEDDILVTPEGHEVLTHEAPKDRIQIEELRSSAYSA